MSGLLISYVLEVPQVNFSDISIVLFVKVTEVLCVLAVHVADVFAVAVFHTLQVVLVLGVAASLLFIGLLKLFL
jgi:hypothetical protein